MRGILAKLTCLIVLVFSVALMPQTGWAQLSSGSYVTTGQTGAQTQIDAFHTSSFTIAVQDPTLFKGGVFTMKAGTATHDPITFRLYDSPAKTTVLAEKSYPSTSAFCAAHGGNCQSYAPTDFSFPSPVTLNVGQTYYAELTSPAPDAQSKAYFIKGAKGCYVAKAGGRIEPGSSCTGGEVIVPANQPYLSVDITDPLPEPEPDEETVEEVTYPVTVVNDGDEPTPDDSHVYVELPVGVTFVDDTSENATCTAAGSVVDCQLDTPLQPGEESEIGITVDVPDTIPDGTPLSTTVYADRNGSPVPLAPGQCVANSSIDCMSDNWNKGDFESTHDNIADAVEEDVKAYMAGRLDSLVSALDQESRLIAFRDTACGFSKSASLNGAGNETAARLNGTGAMSIKGTIIPTADVPEVCSDTNVWAEADFRYVAGDRDTTGNNALATVGVEHLLNDALLVGLRASLDYTDVSFGRSSLADSDISGYGWFAGPYFSAELFPNVFLDGFAGYGTSWNDYDGNYSGFDLSGDFTTQRLLGYVNLSGAFEAGRFVLSPLAGVSLGREWSDAFSVSNNQLGGTEVDSQTAELGRANARLDIAYKVIEEGNEKLDLIAAPSVSYDFLRDNSDVANALLGNSAWRGGIDGGFRYAHGNFGAGLTVGYEGIGVADWNAYRGQVQMNYTW